ncbi:MAG TPA: VCBS repeat-containing protein, partial [bacterium]|nr:VCBS repeat-containing protein [bacterium]
AKDNSTQNFRTMATGDYNGDGCDDIAVAAPGAGGAGVSRGQVYIYFGRGENCDSDIAIDGASPDVTFEGGTDNDELGRGEIYTGGDIDGDGKGDFILPSYKNVYIAYGGDSGGQIMTYTVTGLKDLPGLRIGSGDLNGDGYSDVVIGDESRIVVHYGSSTGISGTASVIINDISTVNYTYPPSVANFAMAISHNMPDINGDGAGDLITASGRGLLGYFTNDDVLMTSPSIYDPFISTTSTNLKILLLEHGIVYCDSLSAKGSCYILNYGE